MEDEAASVNLPLSLAQITAFRPGKQAYNGFGEREVLAICKECCSALQRVVDSGNEDGLVVCPDSFILHPNGNITVIKSEGDVGNEFQAPESQTMGFSEKSCVYSLGETLLNLKNNWPEDSTLYHLLQNLTLDDPNQRLALAEVDLICKHSLHRLSGQYKEGDKHYGWHIVPNTQDATSSRQERVSSGDEPLNQSTKDSTGDSSCPLTLNELIQQPQEDIILVKPVPSQGKMASGGNLGPPSLEAFGNLSTRAQEILKKIYSSESSSKSETSGISKVGSDSNISSNEVKHFGFDSEGRLAHSNPASKRNSLVSMSDSLLSPLSGSPREHSLSRRYSDTDSKISGIGSGTVSSPLNVSPVPIITVSRPESETPPLQMSNDKPRARSLDSAVTAQVSSALTKFIKSRKISGVSKPLEKSTDASQDSQKVSERLCRDSVDYSSSLGGTDDECSSGHKTDGDWFMLDDPFAETESEPEGDTLLSNRIRSNSIATCNLFNSKPSAFRATQLKTARKSTTSLSHLSEIQEEENKPSSGITSHTVENDTSAYSNIKDLAQLRYKRASEIRPPESHDLFSSTTTHFTPIVLSSTKPEGSVSSPIMDIAKVKAKKAMELIKSDLKVSRKEKPPPSMLQDLENDAADFVPVDQGNSLQPVKEMAELEGMSGKSKSEKQISENVESQSKSELTTDQKLKLLFEKHGLASPNPSPCSSPNPAGSSRLSRVSRITPLLEENEKQSSDAGEVPVKHSGRDTMDKQEVTKEIDPVVDLRAKRKISGSQNVSSPIFKREPVTVVQHSPLMKEVGFAPIFKPEEKSASDGLSSNLSVAEVSARKSPLVFLHRSSLESNEPQKTTPVCDNASDPSKYGINERGRIEEVKNEVEHPVKSVEDIRLKEEPTDIDRTTDLKARRSNKSAMKVVSTPQAGNISSESGSQEKTATELVKTGSILSQGTSEISDPATVTLNALEKRDTPNQLANKNIPIQVQLQQDPETGLYRVLPVGAPLQGLPMHITPSSSTPTSPVQSVTNSTTAIISPGTTHTPSPSSLVSTSPGGNKLTPRKKKFVDTSSDPDSSALSHRYQHRNPPERRKEHTKKRTERSKYSVSPHKKSLNKLSNLITDSESSESSFSSPVPVLGHEKSQAHIRPHRKKPTRSPASSSHGDSDHRKERHKDQVNAMRSPQVEKIYREHGHRSQSKPREKSCPTPPSNSSTPTGDHKSQMKLSHHNRLRSTQARLTTDDMDDTRPVDHTLMLSSPVSVSMSSPSRDSGVHLRYATSSGEDLPLIQEAHLADALQGNSHLKKVIKQIRQAFAFDGYLENGVEDLQMAEYISSLASVTYTTFSSAVTEKFCDLYWEEELLEGLYEAVNGKKPAQPTTKSTPTSQKSSEVNRKSKETALAAKDLKIGRDQSRGRNETKRSSSEKTSGESARKMASKSNEPRGKHEEGEGKSREKVAERKSAASKDAKSHRTGSKTEGSRERKTLSPEPPRPTSSKKLLSEGDGEKGSQQGQGRSSETRRKKSTEDIKADSKRVQRQGQARDKSSGEKKETRVTQKDESEKKQEHIGGHVQNGSEGGKESRRTRSEEASASRSRKVSADSKDGRESRNSKDGRESRNSRDGRESRNSRDGRERRAGRVNHERREDSVQRRKFDTTEEEDIQMLSPSNTSKTSVKPRIGKLQEINDENGNTKSQESLLSSFKDSSHGDHDSHDSLLDHLNDSSYLSSTSDLSSSLPLPKQQSTPLLSKTLPVTKTEVIQSRLTPVGRHSPGGIQGPLGSSRRDSIASFSSTSSGTSSRTHQSFATGSLADSMLESSIEENRLVMPSGVLFSGDKVDPSVAEYAQNLTGCGETQNSIESKISEVDQQLTLEKRSQKKTAKFYRKLQEKVTSENKGIASKVKQELAETNQKIEFLESAKRHLEMLYAEQWGLDFALLYSFATISGDGNLVRQMENPLLTMHTVRTNTTLQAGEPTGLFSYLYARQALLDGYLPHFFYTYHYFATSQQLLDFITSRFLFASKQKLRNEEDDLALSIIARTCFIDILHVWVEGFFDVDFKPYPQFLHELLLFVSDQMVPVEQQSKFLLQLLERRQQDASNGLTSVAARVQNSESSLPTITKPLPLPWQVPNSSHSDKSGGFKASLMACFVRKPSKQQEPMAYTPAPHAPREGFHMGDHTSQTIAHVLTLIQQALFIQVHPIHFLNSRCHSISVKDTAKSPYSLQLQPTPSSKTDGDGVETKSLFAEKVFEGKEIRDLLDLGQVVSHWVSAEVVSSSSAKAQVALLSKFISAAKTCFELRNFASCVQILDGLDNVIVRQVPAWRDLPSKVVTIYEELNASRVLLQGDSEYLMKGEKTSPTLPATLLFLLHVQQLEIGGFQLTNGMFKWNKLRSIAKLVDEIRIFQEASYSFDVESSLPGQLKQRMDEFSSQDIHVLAARHSSNYHQLSSDKGRKFTSTFQKMRAGLH
ncbi:uncharacterized protein LOC121425125 [Lytechinus variegatus]|uniref:uncharacterized protein LOC121425125 n=1 Tax=Lytechinus variegatus TaxID=7654 RepID=UPI001BB13E81|nr:uncharacterized protein LOC121425125 [Lytechinus variegatus]